MIRALIYLTAGAAIWLAEGFLFSYFLQFHPWQVVLIAAVYLGLLVVAVRLLRRQMTTRQDAGSMAVWRYLSLAPMLVVIVGSFASLPILILIAALGKLVNLL